MVNKCMRWTVFLFVACLLLSGCAAERRREAMERAVDLKTQVELLQQRVEAQERRLEKLETQVFEMGKR